MLLWKSGLWSGHWMEVTTLQDHPSGHLGEKATPWSADETLHGQPQRVDFPNLARAAHDDLPQKRQKGDLGWIVPHVPLTTHSVKGLNWTELATEFRMVFNCGPRSIGRTAGVGAKSIVIGPFQTPDFEANFVFVRPMWLTEIKPNVVGVGWLCRCPGIV